MNERYQTLGAIARTLAVAAGVVLLAAPLWGIAVLLGFQTIATPNVHGPGFGIIFITLVGIALCVAPLAIILGCLIPGRSDLPTVPRYRIEPGQGKRFAGAVALFLLGPVIGWLLGAFLQDLITGMLAPPVFASILAISAVERVHAETTDQTDA